MLNTQFFGCIRLTTCERLAEEPFLRVEYNEVVDYGWEGGGGETKEISMKNTGVKELITNRII